MKGYKLFIFVGLLLLVLYIVAEINRPQPINWKVTLSKNDRNPYGSYILYEELNKIFPNATINSYREPIYNRMDGNEFKHTAYICIDPELGLKKLDVEAACKYVQSGNFLFISSFDLGEELADTLGLKTRESEDLLPSDSTTINFVNPSLKASKNYTFKKLTITEYFSKINKMDSIIVLGVNNKNQPNFVKLPFGDGAFFIHSSPICFSNYFMLNQNNNNYTSKALSYIPKDVTNVMWDEYYKTGRGGPQTPLRFFLGNTFLRWALWLNVIGLLTFVLFERKRKQRIIPVIPPLKNATMDFVQTVAGVYFNQHDNKGIAEKKIQFWMDFVRQQFYITTQQLDNDFVQQLSKKSGVDEKHIQRIIEHISMLHAQQRIGDAMLIDLSKTIDSFYQLAK